MTVTINGTDGVSAVAANAVGAGDIQSAAVSQANLAAGVAGNGPAFSAYDTALVSTSNNTWTKITFSTEEYDTNSNFASSRFTPTVAGYYSLSATIAAPPSGTGICSVQIYKNGSVFKTGSQSANVATYGFFPTINAIVYANGTTDYFEIYGYQNTGGAGNMGSNSQSLFFCGALVRAA